jgi:hypothetical protein
MCSGAGAGGWWQVGMVRVVAGWPGCGATLAWPAGWAAGWAREVARLLQAWMAMLLGSRWCLWCRGAAQMPASLLCIFSLHRLPGRSTILVVAAAAAGQQCCCRLELGTRRAGSGPACFWCALCSCAAIACQETVMKGPHHHIITACLQAFLLLSRVCNFCCSWGCRSRRALIVHDAVGDTWSLVLT